MDGQIPWEAQRERSQGGVEAVLEYPPQTGAAGIQFTQDRTFHLLKQPDRLTC